MEPVGKERALKAQFRQYDKDGDGKLSFDEMFNVLQAGNPSFTGAQLRAVFADLDKNGDGMVIFDEFVDFVSSQTKRAKGVVLADVPWSTEVGVPRRYLRFGGRIALTEQRGIVLLQLRSLADLVEEVVTKVALMNPVTGQQITWDSANLYDVNDHFVKPLTLRFRCSFVELIATVGPQRPTWFVSHWWGTEVRRTLVLLDFHAKQRDVGSGSAYWICTFANNQHDLSELGSSLTDTPFVRAILSNECVGTVALFDAKVTTLRRVWCVLENYVSTVWAIDRKSGRYLYDIAAWLPEGQGLQAGGEAIPAKPTLRMDLGDGKMQERVFDDETGGAFPLTVSSEGVKIDIYEAQASRQEDWKNILHLIAETPEGKRVDDPPERCEAYDRINHNVQRMFAAGAMYHAALCDDTKQLDRLLLQFPDMMHEGVGNDTSTPLHGAAFKNSLKALQLLLRAQADPNIVKAEGASPVFLASQYGHVDALTLLLRAKGDANRCRTTDKCAPIHVAAKQDNLRVLQTLLKARAVQDQQTSTGETALHIAAAYGHAEAVKMLLQCRASVDQLNSKGYTPLKLARTRDEGNSDGVVKALLDAKADPALGKVTSAKKTMSAFAAHTFGETALNAMASASMPSFADL
eukprot:TRINITY_DN91107_c0_g1_i1.p1 TRINITY_DN91107_c0_g1~~TRINITY_DN91107_c0_g1_i1.p1  ORF type:complete len:633 (+),score=109.58 TRINITY_DN91107_c0_g1_i1:81-1979(+)